MARSEADRPTSDVEQNAKKTRPDPVSGDLCGTCKTALVVIRLEIDGNTLLMQSCETCDIRSWRLDGETIDRKTAISEVGDQTGRRK